MEGISWLSDVTWGEIKGFREMMFPKELASPEHEPYFSIEHTEDLLRWVSKDALEAYLIWQKQNDRWGLCGMPLPDCHPPADIEDITVRQLREFKDFLITPQTSWYTYFELEHCSLWALPRAFMVMQNWLKNPKRDQAWTVRPGQSSAPQRSPPDCQCEPCQFDARLQESEFAVEGPEISHWINKMREEGQFDSRITGLPRWPEDEVFTAMLSARIKEEFRMSLERTRQSRTAIVVARKRERKDKFILKRLKERNYGMSLVSDILGLEKDEADKFKEEERRGWKQRVLEEFRVKETSRDDDEWVFSGHLFEFDTDSEEEEESSEEGSEDTPDSGADQDSGSDSEWETDGSSYYELFLCVE